MKNIKKETIPGITFPGLDLGYAIRLFCAINNIKQVNLAKQLGLSANYISMIMNGRKEPSLEVLCNIAKVFKIPLWGLIKTAETTFNESCEDIKSFGGI